MIGNVRIRRALTLVALVLVGAGLVTISYAPPRRGEAELAEPVMQPRPSTTWAPLPTRADTSRLGPAATPDLQVLHSAILAGDLTSAELLWEALQNSGPDQQTGEMLLAGARVALLREDAREAESRAWAAIGIEPQNAEAWSFLGVVLRAAGDAELADQALAVATVLEPNLADRLFSDRWALAVAQGVEPHLANLAEAYASMHPGSPIAPYYRSQALLAAGETLAAIELLVDGIQQHPDSPALIWYALGEAYLARSGYREAAVAFDVAAALLARGDTSLYQASPNPLSDLNSRLAESYVHSSRCAEAEDIARRLLAARPDLGALVEQAVICQTPTPTPTAWIPTPWIPTPQQ
ncbi:MAG: hypothetical protein MUF84_13765 [Anaerolineae bacterium]|jgi:tetratricopeptide (TPR) repeat protein|nr:hypothetical protein [Anaerolineae bacterium]